MTIDEAMEVALQHHKAGRFGEAEKMYRQVLANVPRHARAMSMLGVLCGQRGDAWTGIRLIEGATFLDPARADFFSNLGTCLLQAGQLDRAIAAYQKAIGIRSDMAEAHLNLGIALRKAGRGDAAMEEIALAARINPKLFDAQSILGEMLAERGMYDEAIAAFERAIEIRPESAEVHCNLGAVYRAFGRMGRAVELLERAIQLRPDYAHAYMNLGVALSGMGRLDEAIAAHQKAIELKPDLAEAHSDLGLVLANSGRIREAIPEHFRAVELSPESAKIHSNLVFALHYHPDYDSMRIREAAVAWALRHEKPLMDRRIAVTNGRDADRRIRIGYVSPDFRDHALGRNLLPVFENHDHRNFEIFFYSDVACEDEFTGRIKARADHWRRIFGRGDEEVAQAVREDGIDILVDLTMHMSGNRLLVFARKPAPIQVTFGAYPGTTGMRAMGYRFADPVLDPPGQNDDLYTERTIRLPDCLWCFDRSAMDAPEETVNGLPALGNGYVTFGSLNNFCKTNDVTWDLWARVLGEVEGSHLLLQVPDGSARREIVGRLGEAGIDSKRIEFSDWVPRREYFKLYERIDLGLDTIPYNGHTTSMDSFWMGVGVVTLLGRTVVGRAGASMLTNLGLTGLIARTPEEYVATAKRLAGDLAGLADLRAGMRERMKSSPLTDGKGFARGIEAVYREIWRKWVGST